MKTTKQSILRKVVLLLTFAVMLTFLTATAVLAAGGDTQTLTFHFDPQKCSVELSSNQLDKPIQLENGVPVEVPHGADVTVTVRPNEGYTVKDIKNAETNASMMLQPNVYREQFLTYSAVANVQCDTKVFDVSFYMGDITYKPVGDDLAELRDVKYHYMKADQITVLPEVYSTGYTFQGWFVINSNGEKVLSLPKYEEGEYQNRYYIPHTHINTEIDQSGIIYLYAEFTPELQPVIRYDYVVKFDETTQKWNTDKQLGTHQWAVEAGTTVSGLTFVPGNDAESTDDSNPYLNYHTYAGYKLFTDLSYYSSKDIIPATAQNPYPNKFERYYTPIVYTLDYQLGGGSLPTDAPMTYTYDEHTQILQPTRRGYTFKGWIVVVDGVEVINAGNAVMDFVLGNKGADNAQFAAQNEQITLIATWQANPYEIKYEWNVPQELVADMNAWNAGLPGIFTFDTPDFYINNPFRKGYTFAGWTMTCSCTDHESGSVVGLTPGEGRTYLDCAAHAGSITLTADWEAETYKVVLDGQGGDEGFTTQIENVKYDQAFVIPEGFILPQKIGYTFGGYWSAPNGGGTQYIDKDGNSVCTSWNIDGDNGGTITLYAYWIINQYNVVLDSITGFPAGTAVTVKVILGDKTYTYNEIPVSVSLDYNTTFRVEITIIDNNFRLVKWNGEDVADYLGITFVSGDITVGAEDVLLTAEARPSKPNVGAGQEVDVTLESETEIKVNFKDAETAQKYDIAISDTNDATNLDWTKVEPGQTQYIFGGLDEGTKYYIFVRLSETDTTLAGIPASVNKTTQFFYFVQTKENELKDLITDNDGDCVKILVQLAIDKIYGLIPENGELPENFNQSVADIVAEVKAQLAFARLQDEKIAELQAYRDACGASGSFRQENLAEIGQLCAVAVTNISAASAEEEVNALFEEAMASMKAIPATYLFGANNDVTLESLLGLNFGSSIQLSSIQDINALRRAIADAIAQGKITAYSSISLEKATELLRTLDTISAYNFTLVNVQVSDGDVFTVTLTIPEALINCTGLQVAYFNQVTGMVELLETSRKGNTLVFKATYIADFVILADPTVDLTAVIIALGAILFCQLLAIVLILIARSKAKKHVMHASIALPMFLTIHFLPVANAELIALGLGLGVLLAQIVLMWLLLSSGMIRIFKFKRKDPQKKEVTAVVREEDLQESIQTAPQEEPVAQDINVEVEDIVDEVVDEVITEVIDDYVDELIEEATEEPVEEVIEEAIEEEIVEGLGEEATEEKVLDEDAFDQELAAELAAEQNEEYVEEVYADEVYDEGEYDEVAQEVLDENAEEVYEDEEFVAEEAPEEYNSTDEEEDVYAYNQEEAERVSDAIETDQETEETTYDADPFAGVFGESAGQNGNSSNEARDSEYEDAYGDAYEYDDGAEYPYAETEDADREETSGQGSFDSTSYIVNDEEISEEEEMYQYDE